MTLRSVPGSRLALALLSALLAVGLVARPERAQAAPLDGVCDELRSEAAAFDGRLAFVALDLTDSARCSYAADEVFIMASLYKLLVLAEAYSQQEPGHFSFDEPIAIVRPPPPDDQEAGTQTVTMSSGEAARLMIQVSDNNTAEALRTRLGKENVAALPARLGMPNTVLGLDFTTTASDIAHYLAQLNAGRLISAESDAAILELLLGQQVNDRIPWFLPDDVPIAHKTGGLDRFAHDAGIVYVPGGPYLLVVLTEGASTQQQGYEAIRSLAELSYRAFAEPRPAAPLALPPFVDPQAAKAAESLVVAVTSGPAVASATAALQPDATPAVASAADQPAPALGQGGGAGVPPPQFGGGSPWWQTQPGLVSLFGAFAVAFAAVFGLRQRRRPLPAEPAMDSIDYRAERPVLTRVMGGVSAMRIKASGRKAVTTAETVQTDLPDIEDGSETRFAVASPRLQRLSGYFRSQLEQLEEMSRELEAETAPFLELLARQQRTVEQVLVHLDERLGPLREYNESEEANLDGLQQRIGGEGMDFIARSFSDYVTQQRQRIAETRQHIDDQREPFEQLALDQRDSVELALARFDEDIEALEGNLSEQRRVLMRLLDGMRSDDFHEVSGLLAARQQACSDAASSGVTDPAEIGASMQALRRAMRPGANGNPHLDEVLEGLEQADERLLTAGDPPTVRALNTADPEEEPD